MIQYTHIMISTMRQREKRTFTKERKIFLKRMIVIKYLISIKALGLYKIAIKPKVFSYKDLFSKVVECCTLVRGFLASPIGNVSIINGSVFKDMYKMLQPDLVYDGESECILLAPTLIG